MNKKNSFGFTLVELLVVVGIIIILGGIAILIINPIQQQNNARNSMIRSTVLKIAYGINSARSSGGHIPGNSQIVNSISSMMDAEYVEDAPLNARFNIEGIKLPDSCAPSNVPGSGENACKFVVYSEDLSGSNFRVYVEGYDINHTDIYNEIVYYYVSHPIAGFFECMWESVPTDINVLNPVDQPTCFLIN